jgi:hypothetical protein
MNERIRELWSEAAESTIGDSWEEQTKFMERFVELIVAECASIAYRESCYSDPENVMGFDIAKKIEEHFGVEE